LILNRTQHYSGRRPAQPASGRRLLHARRTRGTSAGGAAEAGKFLRVPGTNPFFPLKHAVQGNRFWALLESSPMEVYLLNHWRTSEVATTPSRSAASAG